MKNDKTELFERMPVGKALLIMAVPTIVSQLITMIYNLADTFFIGMSDDPYKVAAASVVSILYFLLTSLSNLFGVGGGSLLILWLTLVLGMDQETARGINLLFFIPSALCASILRLRGTGKPCWRTVIPAASAGCIGAVLFSLLGNGMDTQLLKRLFGILLLAAGTRELLYRPKKK